MRNNLFVIDTNTLVSAFLSEHSKPTLAYEAITDCRDPKDNKFLELAVSANASCIITGDKDLLILNPCLPNRQAFRSIPILNAVDFLNNF